MPAAASKINAHGVSASGAGGGPSGAGALGTVDCTTDAGNGGNGNDPPPDGAYDRW